MFCHPHGGDLPDPSFVAASAKRPPRDGTPPPAPTIFVLRAIDDRLGPERATIVSRSVFSQQWAAFTCGR